MDMASDKLTAIPPAERRMLASVTSDSIRSRQFSVVRRGLSPTEVRQYLALVAQWIDGLKREVVELTSQPHAPQTVEPNPGDLYGDLGARMAEVLRSVDEQAQQLRLEVKEQADRHLQEARRQADEVRAEAHAYAARIRQEATETIRSLVERRDTVVAELEDLLERMGTVADMLRRDLGVKRPEGPQAAPVPSDPIVRVDGAEPELASSDYGRS